MKTVAGIFVGVWLVVSWALIGGLIAAKPLSDAGGEFLFWLFPVFAIIIGLGLASE